MSAALILRLSDLSSSGNWYFHLGMDYPAVAVFFLFWIFALGSCLGSFLNVCIWRMPLGESIADAPSHCTSCGNPIRWYDNLPVISYLVLRGRCRHCHTHYSCRYLVVEVLTGLLFVALFIKTGRCGQPPALLTTGFAMIMLCITTGWIDAEHRLIPDATTIPALLWALIAAACFPQIWGTANRWYAVLASLGSAAAAGGCLALFSLLGRALFKREALGWGDVKFIAAAAALLGVPGAFFSLLAGSFSGAAYGIGRSLTGGGRLNRMTIPFGPFLAAGALLWLFIGERLLRSYLTMAGVFPLAD